MCKSPSSCHLLALLMIIFFSVLPLPARNTSPCVLTVKERLERGEVIVGLQEIGTIKYVTGSVLINEPPEAVWPIMANPFEFLRKISPRMKAVEVVTDQDDLSVLKITLDVFPIPHFTYVVESRYENGSRVSFKRISGILKDFRGTWEMSPADGGSKTQRTYSMYIEPGFPFPQWIVREGVKSELPRTLTALRRRVDAVSEKVEVPESRTILAASIKPLATLHHRLPSSIGTGTP